MPQVVVNINGKPYRMACDEGEETRLQMLGQRLDGYVNELKLAFGEIGDQRLTVMAGVMVTDALTEAERKISLLESELANLKKVRDQELTTSKSEDDDTLQLIKSATQAVNNITNRLKDRPDLDG